MKTARSYLRVPMTFGFLELDGPRCELTDLGEEFMSSRDLGLIYEQLVVRVAGVEEILDLLRIRPRRMGLLHEELKRQGFPWSKDTQVRYRLRWLEAVGVVRREGKARPIYHVVESAKG